MSNPLQQLRQAEALVASQIHQSADQLEAVATSSLDAALAHLEAVAGAAGSRIRVAIMMRDSIIGGLIDQLTELSEDMADDLAGRADPLLGVACPCQPVRDSADASDAYLAQPPDAGVRYEPCCDDPECVCCGGSGTAPVFTTSPEYTTLDDAPLPGDPAPEAAQVTVCAPCGPLPPAQHHDVARDDRPPAPAKPTGPRRRVWADAYRDTISAVSYALTSAQSAATPQESAREQDRLRLALAELAGVQCARCKPATAAKAQAVRDAAERWLRDASATANVTE